jgi:hypothetical protein
MPLPVALRPKAWVCGCWLAEIVGSNPAGSCECCVFPGRSVCVGLITRPEEFACSVSECDHGSSIMMRPLDPLGLLPIVGKKKRTE